MVRTVTRQLEAEWDEDTRALAEGLDLHDAECCPGCGTHKTILDDPENNGFTFEERTCAVCAGQDVYGRVIAEGDEEWRNQHKEPAATEPRPDDGRHVYLRRLTPQELAERQLR